MIEIFDRFPELVVGAAGSASLAIKTWVCRIEFDGLIDLFDGMVIVARELEAGCSQDERVALLGFGRWLSDFSVRFARWNAASRKKLTGRRILCSRKVRYSKQHGETCRQCKKPDGARLVGTPFHFVRV